METNESHRSDDRRPIASTNDVLIDRWQRLNGSAPWHSGDYRIPFAEQTIRCTPSNRTSLHRNRIAANRKRKRTGRLTGLADYD